MKIKLNLKRQLTMREHSVFSQENVPCILTIGKNGNFLNFSNPLLACQAVLSDIDFDKLEIAPAMSGDIIYDNFATVSLKPIIEDEYHIYELSLFYDTHGWLKIISEGAFVTSL